MARRRSRRWRRLGLCLRGLRQSLLSVPAPRRGPTWHLNSQLGRQLGHCLISQHCRHLCLGHMHPPRRGLRQGLHPMPAPRRGPTCHLSRQLGRRLRGLRQSVRSVPAPRQPARPPAQSLPRQPAPQQSPPPLPRLGFRRTPPSCRSLRQGLRPTCHLNSQLSRQLSRQLGRRLATIQSASASSSSSASLLSSVLASVLASATVSSRPAERRMAEPL